MSNRASTSPPTPDTPQLSIHQVDVLPDRTVIRLEGCVRLELTLRVAPATSGGDLQQPNDGSERRSRNPNRDLQIAEDFKSGSTLAAIGSRFGLTRERVRQIVTRDGVARLHRNAFDRFVCEKGEAVDRAFERLRHPAAVAQDLDLPERMVRTYLLGREQEVLPLPRASKSRFTNEQLVDSLRAAATEVGRLTGKRYAEWRNSRTTSDKPLPSAVLIIQRFGSWRDAMRAAGLVVEPARRTYRRRWTEDLCTDSVRRFVGECVGRGERPTAAAYETWAAGRDDAPCLGTLRLRLGRWAEALRSAHAAEAVFA